MASVFTWLVADDPALTADANRAARGEHKVVVHASHAERIRQHLPWAGVAADDSVDLLEVLAITLTPSNFDSDFADKVFVECIPTLFTKFTELTLVELEQQRLHTAGNVGKYLPPRMLELTAICDYCKEF